MVKRQRPVVAGCLRSKPWCSERGDEWRALRDKSDNWILSVTLHLVQTAFPRYDIPARSRMSFDGACELVGLFRLEVTRDFARYEFAVRHQDRLFRQGDLLDGAALGKIYGLQVHREQVGGKG